MAEQFGQDVKSIYVVVISRPVLAVYIVHLTFINNTTIIMTLGNIKTVT